MEISRHTGPSVSLHPPKHPSASKLTMRDFNVIVLQSSESSELLSLPEASVQDQESLEHCVIRTAKEYVKSGRKSFIL